MFPAFNYSRTNFELVLCCAQFYFCFLLLTSCVGYTSSNPYVLWRRADSNAGPITFWCYKTELRKTLQRGSTLPFSRESLRSLSGGSATFCVHGGKFQYAYERVETLRSTVMLVLCVPVPGARKFIRDLRFYAGILHVTYERVAHNPCVIQIGSVLFTVTPIKSAEVFVRAI